MNAKQQTVPVHYLNETVWRHVAAHHLHGRSEHHRICSCPTLHQLYKNMFEVVFTRCALIVSVHQFVKCNGSNLCRSSRHVQHLADPVKGSGVQARESLQANISQRSMLPCSGASWTSSVVLLFGGTRSNLIVEKEKTWRIQTWQRSTRQINGSRSETQCCSSQEKLCGLDCTSRLRQAVNQRRQPFCHLLGQRVSAQLGAQAKSEHRDQDSAESKVLGFCLS